LINNVVTDGVFHFVPPEYTQPMRMLSSLEAHLELPTPVDDEIGKDDCR
jgi:hypothetical protein